jgi:hypothetical protein
MYATKHMLSVCLIETGAYSLVAHLVCLAQDGRAAAVPWRHRAAERQTKERNCVYCAVR